MAQFEISDILYQQLYERAQQSGQTMEMFLASVLANQPLAHPGFVSLVTHDLRTPLATIMTSSDILNMFQDRLSDQDWRDHLAVIRMQVRIANDMLDNVMVIQKCATDSLALDLGVHDLCALCRIVIDEMDQVTQKSHPISLTTSVEMVNATVDFALVRLALVNILLNAIRFSERGSAIRVSLSLNSDSVTFSVTDRGIGIPDDELDRVCDLFYRATNSSKFPGRGLGLAVVRDILDLHSGDITLNSALNTGTIATLHFPLKPPRL
jgi:signal transduction histidine kinase